MRRARGSRPGHARGVLAAVATAAAAAALVCCGGSSFVAAAEAAAGSGEVDCEDLGFSPGSLLCGSCDDMETFLGESSAALVADCRRCCASERGDSGARFHKATLELDEAWVSHFPELQQLIERVETAKDAGDPLFSDALTIKHVDRARPKLTLRRGKVRVVEDAFVKFKVDEMVAFLDAKLKPPKGATAPGTSSADSGSSLGKDEL
eukprot:PRCOL_00000728-RA